MSTSSPVSESRQRYQRLVSAITALTAAHPDEALALAQVAATFAWKAPPGFFADSRLEELIIAAAGDVADPPRGSAHRQLHVATSLHSVGGHSRLLRNWLAASSTARDAVCVTQQTLGEVPREVRDDFSQRGVTLFALGGSPEKLRATARALSALAHDSALVVLHTDPGDVTPLAALGAAHHRPPCVVLNHADHVFWLGRAIADRVINLRESARALCVDRRGIPGERCGVAGIPLDVSGSSVPEVHAGDMVTITSMAQAYKFEGSGPVRYFDIADRVLRATTHVRFDIIGPSGGASWSELQRRYPGRVQLRGKLSSPGAVLRAADIYVDSCPFASLTSMLEAARSGLPLVGPTIPPGPAGVLASDDPALRTCMMTAPDADGISALLIKLADSPEMRREAGQRARQEVARHHSLEAWASRLPELLSVTVQPAPSSFAAQSIEDGLAESLHHVLTHGQVEARYDACVEHGLRGLDLAQRARVLRAIGAVTPGLAVKTLTPGLLMRALRSARYRLLS